MQTKLSKTKYNRRRYLRDKEKILAEAKLYRIRNRKKISEAKKLYRIKNKKLVAQRTRKYYLKNRERMLEYARSYRAKNKELTNKKISDYMKTPQGRILFRKKVLARRKRTVVARVGGVHTEKQWSELVIKFKRRCVICRKKTRLTRDHIIPISKGGSDDISNIQPLCLQCNSSKGNKL